MVTEESIESILKVGGAGGTITLFGIKLPDGQWDFFIECNEAAMFDLMSEEDCKGFIPKSQPSHIHSIEDAFLSLGKYPWFKLMPLEIHPDFHDKIIAEVNRLGGRPETDRWQKALKDRFRLSETHP